MKTEQEYINDLTEIRSMMERSTRFLSLTGWSGIMAGIYALAGALIAWIVFFNKDFTIYSPISQAHITGIISLSIAILILAVGTAVLLSLRKAGKKRENLWNTAARRLIVHLAIPLITGGIFILIMLAKGFFELAAPLTLIFYGLALLNASKFTFDDVKYLGMAQIMLGLLATYFSGYGLLFWAAGFGIMHIIYGVYMHLRYEK
jgi:hypothetical protein